MLSKNNWQEQFRKQEPKKQRFTIKKLTVGVASVLIGFTFMAGTSASADQVQQDSQAPQDSEAQSAGAMPETMQSSVALGTHSTSAASDSVDDNSAATSAQPADSSAQLKSAQPQSETPVKVGSEAPADVSDKGSTAPASSSNSTSLQADHPSESAEVKGQAKPVSVAGKEDLKGSNEGNQSAQRLKEILGDPLGLDSSVDSSVIPNKHVLTLSDVRKKMADFENNAALMSDEEREKAANDLKAMTEKLSAADQFALANGSYAGIGGDQYEVNGITVTINGFSGLSRALFDKNITKIVLDGDIDLTNLTNHEVDRDADHGFRRTMTDGQLAFGGKAGALGLGKYDGIAHTVTIDGNGHNLTMGKWYFTLYDRNYGANGPWNIKFTNFKNISTNSYAPVYMAGGAAGVSTVHAAESTITYDNIENITLNGYALIDSGVKAIINNSNITSTGSNDVIKNAVSVDITNDADHGKVTAGGNFINNISGAVNIDGLKATITNGSLIKKANTATVKNVTDSSVSDGDAITGISGDVNLDSVNLKVNNGSLVDADDSNLVIKGTNVINAHDKDLGYETIRVGNVVFDNGSKTTINMRTDKHSIEVDGKGNMIKVTKGDDGSKPAVDVKQGAVVNLNGQTTDVRGIVTKFNNKTLDQATYGTVNVDGTLNEDLQDGHSNAIMAQNLIIGKNGNVTIHTKQDNLADGNDYSWDNATMTWQGWHFAPIALGTGGALNQLTAPHNNGLPSAIVDNGSLTVIRNIPTTDQKAFSPLISYGSDAPGNGDNKFTLSVGDGAVLDLQDNANNSFVTKFRGENSLAWVGPRNEVSVWGLINMNGTGTINSIEFNNPAYVNLQRTGAQRGTLIKEEGNRSSVTTITGTPANGTPLAQWNSQNGTNTPDEAWRIKSLKTNTAGGDYFSNFYPATPKDSKEKPFTSDGFLKNTYWNKPMGNSNGQVKMAPFEGKDAEYNDGYVNTTEDEAKSTRLGQFLSDFSWSAPRRISFGEKITDHGVQLKEATNYNPNPKTIETTTDHKLSDFKPKEGIANLSKYDGTTVDNDAVDSNGKKIVDWDKSTWGINWDYTDFNKDGKVRKRDKDNKVVKDSAGNIVYVDPTDAQTNAFNQLKYMDGLKPKVDNKGNLEKSGLTYEITDPSDPTKKIDVENAKAATIVYTDGSADFVSIPFDVTDPLSAKYTPSYPESKGFSDEEQTVTPTIKDDATNKDVTVADVVSKDDKQPAFKITDENSKFNVDSKTGVIPVPKDTTPGKYTVPVEVTYNDGSSESTNATVTVDALPEVSGLHTGDATKIPAPKDAITNFNNGKDGQQDGYPSKVEWTTTPTFEDGFKGTKDFEAKVTYPDGNSKNIKIPVSVTGAKQDGNNTIYYGDRTSAEFSSDAVDTHKTTGDHQLDVNGHKFNKIVVNKDWNHDTDTYGKTITYKLSDDGKSFVNDADPTDKFDADKITYQWQSGFEANSDEVSFKDNKGNVIKGNTLKDDDAEKTKAGEDLPGNSRYRYNFTVSDPAVAEKLSVPAGYHSWVNAFYNFYTATPKGGTVEAVHGKTDSLPDASTVVNTTDLTKEHNSEIATKDGKPDIQWVDGSVDFSKTGDQKGKVRINFTDNTYLDVEVPVNVKNNDTDNLDPATKNISTPEGVTPDASTTVTNKPSDNVNNKLPEGTTVAWTNPTTVDNDVKVPGEHTENITVTYPDKSKDTKDITLTVDATPTTQPTRVDENSTNPDATSSITNINNGGKNPTPGYPSKVEWKEVDGKKGPDTKTPGKQDVPVTVTYPDGTTQDVTVPVVVTEQPKVTTITPDDKGNLDPATAITNLHPDGTNPGLPSSVTWKNNDKPTTPGVHNPTVVVTYPKIDGETEPHTVEITIPVVVPDTNQTVISNDKGAVVVTTQPVTTHKTSDKNAAKAEDAIKSVDTYKITDGKITETPSSTSKDGVTASWDVNTVSTDPSTIAEASYNVTVKFGSNSDAVKDGITTADTTKELPTKVTVEGAKANDKKVEVKDPAAITNLSQDDFSKIINHSDLDKLPEDHKVTKYSWATEPSVTDGKVGDNGVVKIDFADGTSLNVPVTSANINYSGQASEFDPSYKNVEMWPGETQFQDIDWGKGASGKPVSAPAGVTFKRWGMTPSWINVDENTGKLTYNPKLSDGWGDNNVTIHATFADGSTKDIKSKVNLKYIQDDISTTVNDVELHKTSGSSMNLNTIAKAISIDTDLSYYIDSTKQDKHPVDHFVAQEDPSGNIIYVADQNSKNPGLTISGVKVSWDGDQPTTNNFDTTAPEDAPRQESGNQMHYPKYSVVIDLSNAKLSKDGKETDDLGLTETFDLIQGNSHSNYVEVHYAGAVGKQNIAVNAGDAVPTDKAALENYMSENDLEVAAKEGYEKLNNWKVKDVSWAPDGKPGKDGKFDHEKMNGTVRFTFDDGDNKSSYLDVLVSFKLATTTHTYTSWVQAVDPTDPGNKDKIFKKVQSKTVTYDEGTAIPSAKFDDVKLPDRPSYYIPMVKSFNGAPAANIVKNEDGTYVVRLPQATKDRQEYGYFVTYTDSREYVQEHLDVYGPNNFTDSSDPHTAEGGYWGTVSRTEIKKGDDGKYPITDVPTQDINDLVKKDIFTNDKTGKKDQTLPEEWAKQGYIPIITAATTEGSHAYDSVQSAMLNKLNNYIKSHPMCTTLPDFTAEVPMDVHFVVHYVKPIDYTPAQKDDDGSYIDDDMNYDSIRYIYVHDATDPTSATTIKQQDVHFSRNINGYAGYVGANGEKVWNPWELDPVNQKVWAEYAIPQIDGYESRLDTRDNRDDVNTIPSEDELSTPVTKVDKIEIGNVNEWTSPTNPVFDENGDYSDGYNSPKEEDVYYTAKDQSTTVTYVDKDGKEVKNSDGSSTSYTVKGKTGKTVDTNIQTNVPKNWQLVGDKVTSQITFGPNGHDPITVQIEHIKTPVNVDKNNWDTYRTTTETVYEKDPVSGKETRVANYPITFTRTGVKDEVTGQTKWTEWKPITQDPDTKEFLTSFPEINVTKPGYSATSADGSVKKTDDGKFIVPASDIDPAKLNKDDNNVREIHVTYTTDALNQRINFVDNSDKTTVVGTQDIPGTVGKVVTITEDGSNNTTKLNVPENWKVVSQYPGTITFGSQDGKPETVYVEHKTEQVIPKEGDNDSYRKITQTIYETLPNQTEPQKVRESYVVYTRTGSKDLVTNKITWGAWTPAVDKETQQPVTSFDKFEVTQAGYTAKSDQVTISTDNGKQYVPASNKITEDSKDQKIYVTYEANDQSVKINYVDNSDHTKIINTQTLTGKTGTKVTMSEDGHEGTTKFEVPAGWSLVPGTQKPKTIPFNGDSKDNPDQIVYVEHKVDQTDGRDHQDDSDVYRHVTRTVTVAVEGKEPQTVTQDLYFYRIKNVDEVKQAAHDSNAVTYTPWTSNMKDGSTSFKAVEVPNDSGYTMTVTGGTTVKKDGKNYVTEQTGLSDKNEPVANINVKVDYKKADQSFKINFVNNDNHNDVVSSQKVSGKTGDTVKVTVDGADGSTKLQVPEGWQLVDDNPTITTTFGTDKPAEDQTVYIQHKKDVTHGYEHKDNDNLYKKVTRTIKVKNIADDKEKSYPESLEFYRDSTYDEVTKETTYGPWTSNMEGKVSSFQKTPLGDVPGYTIEVTGAKKLVEDGKTYVPAQSALDKGGNPVKDFDVVVSYAANKQSTTVTYVDDKGNEVKNSDGSSTSYTLSGKTGEQVVTKIEANVPENWKLVGGQTINQKITFGPNGHDPIKVQVEHKTEDVTKDPSLKDQTTRDVSYTVIDKTDGTKIFEQKATFHRSATKDLVTGDVTYGEWSKNVPVEAVSVAKAGYTAVADNAQIVDGKIPATELTPETGHKVINVTYTSGEWKMSYIFHDDTDNKDVKTTNISGNTDQTVDTNLVVPEGYELADKNTELPKTYKFGSTDGSPVTIHLVHATKTVDKDHVPTGYTKDYFTKTIKRTITVTKPDGKTVDKSQTITLERKGTYDEATKKITSWTDWSTGEFDKVTDIPTVDGYTPSQAEVPEVDNVTADYKDPNINITYTANDSHQTFHYVDENGKDTTGVPDAQVTGKTDEQKHGSDVPVPDGWELVDTPSDFTIPAPDKDTAINVKIKHGKTEVTPNDPKKPGDKIPGTKDQHFPAGVDKNDLNKTISRTITIVNPDGTKNSITQEVSYKRTATVDNVTKKVTYGNWTPADPNVKGFEGVTAPKVPGYTADKTVAALTPDNDAITNWDNSKHNETIKYVAGNTLVSFKFVDDSENGKQVGDIIYVGGNTNETKNIKLTVPDGYKLADGQTIPTEYTFKDQNPEITIHLVHITKTVDQNNVPGGYTKDDFTKTIKRTIIVTMPDGTKKDMSQTTTITRTGTLDEATGKVTFNDWTTGRFDKVTVPTVDGYTPSQSEVPAVPQVTIDYQDPDIQISYTKNPTQADQNTPVAQVINVKKGDTPDPKDGIKNSGDLDKLTDPKNPDAKTIYTWKDGKTPDTTKPGVVTGTVVVTYPDGSKDEVTVKINVLDSSTGTPTEEPEKPALIIVEYKDPTGKVVKTDTKEGKIGDEVEIDIPDGYIGKPVTHKITGNEGVVVVNVVPKPTPTDITVKKGDTPKVEDGISNKDKMPEGTKYTWKDGKTPDTTTPGDKPVTIVVTLPDGIKREVPVTIHVKDNTPQPTQADQNIPQAQDITVNKGETPNPKDGIKNSGDLDKLPDPAGKGNTTKYTWKDGQTPNTSKTGNTTGIVVVTYPDGSQDEVPVTIHVHDSSTGTPTEEPEKPVLIIVEYKDPTGKVVKTDTKEGKIGDEVEIDIPDGYIGKPVTHKITGNEGVVVVNVVPEPTPADITVVTGDTPDPKTGIANNDKMPEGTKYTWKDGKTPDTTTPGDKSATIVATLPDGTTDEVTVTVHVTEPTKTPSDADKYTPKPQPINTPEGQTPDPKDGIENKDDMPTGTTYDWNDKNKVANDMKVPGIHEEVIDVRYSDGSVDHVTVTVTVMAPEGKDITTTQGNLPDPEDAIANKDQMPDGTEYTWKQVPDIDSVGDHIGVVEITFPDGTTYDVTVNVHVTAGAVEKNDSGAVVKNTAVKTNNGNNAQPSAKKLPQTGNDSSKTTAMVGLGLAAFASLFGLAGRDKKRKD